MKLTDNSKGHVIRISDALQRNIFNEDYIVIGVVELSKIASETIEAEIHLPVRTAKELIQHLYKLIYEGGESSEFDMIFQTQISYAFKYEELLRDYDHLLRSIRANERERFDPELLNISPPKRY